MFPYGRSSLSTPTVRNSGTPRRSVIPIGDEDKPISPYFSRLFASPSVRSSNSSYFSPSSPSLSHRSSVFSRELPPSLFNFQSPVRRPIQSSSQPTPPRPRTATEFLRNATSSVIDRAIQKFEYNNRKRPIESLIGGVDEDISISDPFSSKRYHGCYEDNNSSQNAANYSPPIETTLPRPRLKPTSSSSLPRPSSAKLPQQVSRLSSAALEAIAFAATKRQRPSDNLEKESIRVGENDDVSLAPPAAKRRAMRDCETQTVFQVDSATSTRESSPEKLPKRRPPNMTSVNQLFTRLEAKARATSSNLRLAALRKIGGGLASSSLEDRQAYIRRIFEEITDNDCLKFGDGHKSLPNSSFNSPSTSVTVSSSLTTPAISIKPTKSTVPSISLNSEATSKPSESGSSTTSTSTIASTSPSSSFSFGKTSTSTEVPNVSSVTSSITSTLPSFSFGKTSLPEKMSNASSPSLSVASGAVSTSNTSTLPSFSFGKTSLPEKTSVGSSESSVSKPLPSFSFGKAIDAENKTGSTTTTTSTSSLLVPPPNVSVSSSEVYLPPFGKATASTAAEKTASESATSGAPSFKFCFGAGTTVKSSSENNLSPAAGGFNFSLAKITSNRQEPSTKPSPTLTGFGFSLTPKSTVATSLEETEKFIFGQTSTANSNTAVTTSSGSAFGFAPNSTSPSSTAAGFGFSASPSNGTAKNTMPSFSFSSTSTESQKTSAPVSTTSSAPLFNFSGKPTTATTTTASGGFNFPGNLAAVTNTTSVGSSSTAPTFNFSAIALPKPGTATTTGSTPAFSFSTTSSTTAGVSSPFSLPKTAGTTVPPPAFNFSLKPSVASVTTQSSLLDFSFSASTATAPSTFVFSGMPSTTSSTTTVGFETSGFNFPATKTTTAPSVLAPAKIMPSFSFPSVITNTTATTASSSLFSFSTNQPSTTSTAGGFSFSGTTTTSSAGPFGFSASSQNPTSTTSSTFGFGSMTNSSSPFAFNKTGLSNGTSSASPFSGTQNAATTTASSNPFGFSGANAAATTATTAAGFSFSASPSLFKFGSSGQNAPATSTTQSPFSLNLPTIKSSPSMFSTGEATKRPVDSSFTTITDTSSTSAKIGFGGISASNTTPFSSAPAFNFGGSGGTNFTGGFNFNATSAVSGFNFGVSATNPPVFGGSGQASPNPFSAQPTTPNAAASFAQRRRQLRTTRRR